MVSLCSLVLSVAMSPFIPSIKCIYYPAINPGKWGLPIHELGKVSIMPTLMRKRRKRKAFSSNVGFCVHSGTSSPEAARKHSKISLPLYVVSMEVRKENPEAALLKKYKKMKEQRVCVPKGHNPQGRQSWLPASEGLTMTHDGSPT